METPLPPQGIQIATHGGARYRILMHSLGGGQIAARAEDRPTLNAYKFVYIRQAAHWSFGIGRLTSFVSCLLRGEWWGFPEAPRALPVFGDVASPLQKHLLLHDFSVS